MSSMHKNIFDIVDVISDPACIVGQDLEVLWNNGAFSSFCGTDFNHEETVFLEHCMTIHHPWEEDPLITEPFGTQHTCIQHTIAIKNSVDDTITAAIRTIPLITVNQSTDAILLVIQSCVKTGYEDGDVLALIEEQEKELKQIGDVKPKILGATAKVKQLVERQRMNLLEANAALKRVKAEINDELEMAKNVQTSLMPKELPDVTNIAIASIYIPASQVGGDFFDIINTQTQKIAILIFDVSGHGVPSALIGATAKMLFAHYIETMESPAQIFREVNAKICSFLRTEHYLTAFLGILDPIQNVMVYSRAGHVKPLVYHAADKQVTTLDARGFFIGHSALVDIAEYREETVKFEPDDKIICYTDGLTEGCNTTNELYGKDRLLRAVNKFGEYAPQKLLDSILEDQTIFRDKVPLRDDFTMLCIQIGDSEELLRESGFTKKDAPNILSLTTIPEIEKVCSMVLRAMDNFGFSDMEIKRTKICIFEMAINAVLHGNKSDPHKKVLMLYKVEQAKVVISVVDEGNGYDVHSVPDPLLEENLLKGHGRGIHFIKTYMDEVHYNQKANRIMVVKHHQGIEG